MSILVAEGRPPREIGTMERLAAIMATLAAATVGYALAEAMTRARSSDAFMVPPTLAQLAAYAAALAIFVGLALAFELGAPPLVSKGGRASRDLRALIRRRFRHGRTRAEIANVEVGLTISFVAVLAALGLAFATTKSLLVVVMVAAIVLNLKALSAMSSLVGHDVRWSSLIGLVYGLGAGYVLT